MKNATAPAMPDKRPDKDNFVPDERPGSVMPFGSTGLKIQSDGCLIILDEDKEIKLSDLYLVKKVSEKVSIVHNNMDYYIIKKYVKNKENYEV